MEFGVVLQCNPPAWRTVDLARQAELAGFSYVWTFDSHLLWQEPYVIYSQILSATHRIIVGPMVTNPATRDWTVTASTFATLNEMFGNRTVCGIGRGDSAVRVINGKPVALAELRDAISVIRKLANGEAAEYKDSSLRLTWNPNSRLDIYVAAYGPKALALTGEVGDGFILQLADLAVAEWSIKAVRDAAAAAGRDPASVKICVAAPAYIGTDLAHQREQCRWFGGMVGNHVADIVARYGADGGPVPQALTDYIPDEIVDRFCVLGSTDDHIDKLRALKALDVDQFAIYLQHDAKEETLRAYADVIIPALRDEVTAKT